MAVEAMVGMQKVSTPVCLGCVAALTCSTPADSSLPAAQCTVHPGQDLPRP